MMNQFRIKITVLYLLLTLLGGALSLHIYQRTLQVEQNNQQLLEREIPELQSVSLLAQSFTEHERILYEYYATEDRKVLQQNLQANFNSISRELSGLKQEQLSPDVIALLNQHLADQQNIAKQLEIALTNYELGSERWDRARTLLEEMTILGNQSRPLLSQLVEDIKQKVQLSQQESSSQLRSMSALVSVFSIFILLIAIVTGLFITSRLREAREKKRLAMFIERNPNPVASFDWNGEYRYRNPAWNNLRESLHHDLLPDDFLQQIQKLKSSKLNQRHWQQDINEKIFLATLHKQGDLSTFTLYLEDITQRRRVEKELEYLAFNDSLTELSNRRKLDLDANAFIENHPDGVIGVLVIGIDRFSQVTATHGYQVGDQIIIAIKQRIERCLEQFEVEDHHINLYRFTGAKFVILITSNEKDRLIETTHLLVKTIQQSMLSFIANKHGHFYLHLSFGAAYYLHQDHGFTRTLQNADAAFTVARRESGNRFIEFNEDMAAKEKRWLDMEVDLRFAQNRKQFYLMYQPKVCSSSGRLTGIEALVRWQHPDKGFISPAEFIPVAEQSGLIVEIGHWILLQACSQTKRWIESGFSDMVCAVNISPLQFLQLDFLSSVREVLNETGLPPENLELEITEGVLMNDVTRSIQILNDISRMGIKISIDDFGTGYSSLAYLKSFSIDKLKIDKSFIDNITMHGADQSIVKAVIDLAKNLSLKVIAEGVETEEQLDLLIEYGCDEIQGYYFSKPLLPENLLEFAERIKEKAT